MILIELPLYLSTYGKTLYILLVVFCRSVRYNPLKRLVTLALMVVRLTLWLATLNMADMTSVREETQIEDVGSRSLRSHDKLACAMATHILPSKKF